MEVQLLKWVYFVSGAAMVCSLAVLWRLWKTEIRKCRRCRLRGVNCYCVGGPR